MNNEHIKYRVSSEDMSSTNLLVFKPHEILGCKNKPEIGFAALKHAYVVHRQPALANHLHHTTDNGK